MHRNKTRSSRPSRERKSSVTRAYSGSSSSLRALSSIPTTNVARDSNISHKELSTRRYRSNTPKATHTSDRTVSRRSYSKSIDFLDHKEAYKTKTTPDLVFTNTIFTACRFEPLVKNADKLIQFTRSTFGDQFLTAVIEPTFYKHFCAGKDAVSLQPNLLKLANNGVGPILDYAAEAEEEAHRVKDEANLFRLKSAGVSATSNASPTFMQHQSAVIPSTTPTSYEDLFKVLPPKKTLHTVPANDGFLDSFNSLNNTFAKQRKPLTHSDGLFPSDDSESNGADSATSAAATTTTNETQGRDRRRGPSREQAFADAKSVFVFDSDEDEHGASSQGIPSHHGGAAAGLNPEKEREYDRQVDIFLKSIDVVAQSNQHLQDGLQQTDASDVNRANRQKVVESPLFIALKFSALCDPALMDRASSVIFLHNSLWDRFCDRSESTLTLDHLKQELAHRDALERSGKLHVPEEVPADSHDGGDGVAHDHAHEHGEPSDTKKTGCGSNHKKPAASGVTIIPGYSITDQLHNETISREDFCQHILKFYDLSLDDANELYNFIMRGETNSPVMTRSHWMNNLPIQHIIALSSKLNPIHRFEPFSNSKDLLFTIPSSTNPADLADCAALDTLMTRLNKICDYALSKKVAILIDAEQTYYQSFIDMVTLDLMKVYNVPIHQQREQLQIKEFTKTTQGGKSLHPSRLDHEETVLTTGSPLAHLQALKKSLQPHYHQEEPVTTYPIIWTTYQAYLKDAEFRLKRDFDLARRHNFVFAFKVVRGAYMNTENSRAEQLQYTTPIHDNIQDTHDSYNRIMLYMLAQRHSTIPPSQFLVASHNQESLEIAVDYLLEEAKHRTPTASSPSSSPDDFRTSPTHAIQLHQTGVYFGQLYGMAEYLTYPLAQKGFSAYKYIPYGQPLQCLPYLIRRAQENGSMLGGTRLETKLLMKEFRRRLTSIFRS